MLESSAALGCSKTSLLIVFLHFNKGALPEDLCTPTHTTPKVQKYIKKIKQKPDLRLSCQNRAPSFFRLYKQMSSPVKFQSIISDEFSGSFALSLTHTTLSSPWGLHFISSLCLPTKW